MQQQLYSNAEEQGYTRSGTQGFRLLSTEMSLSDSGDLSMRADLERLERWILHI